MAETLKPMDPYSSDMSIPFDVAAYCRGHKYSIEAVTLLRAISGKIAAEKRVSDAETELDQATARMRDCIDAVKKKMERDPT